MTTPKSLAKFFLLIVLLALSVTAHAQYNVTTNTDGSITISLYTGTNGIVTIPNTINGRAVTVIGESAFDGAGNLTNVIIPYTVTNIGEDAFSSCTNLTSVAINSSTLSIGEYAFSG